MELDISESIIRPFERLTPPGTAPGTIVADPEEPPPILKLFAYGPDAFAETEIAGVSGLEEYLHRFPVTWLNIDGLGNAKLIRKIGEMFHLHPLALEDVVHVHQRSKVEAYDGVMFVVARMIDRQDDDLLTEQLSLFVGRDFVITFQGGPPGDCLDPVRERLRKNRSGIRERGPDYLTYALLDAVIDHYFPVVESYGDRIDHLEDTLESLQHREAVSQIQRLRSELLLLRRTLRGQRLSLDELLRGSYVLIGQDTRFFFRDCQDHVIQLAEAVEAYRETCTNLRDYHLATLSIRAGEATKTLTIIATLFIPMSFVAGLYGMNFRHMPELGWIYGYPFALGLMTVIAAALLAWFWRQGWFRS